ncbi:hypothetical protein DRF59_00935 [Chryseobacterium flavum]|uniref:Uncharacterized protein n=1 Tax=Chryseobacterium flavum TaxID=415851 RepID=A0A3D9CUM8_9FLAO|nr:hypothetical protein [Chryseobacterium flavum]REC69462.1 hypothetical protein DRF59_00935 [Chryseobacterium flavum]
MDTANNTYPDLKFPSSELSAFAVTIDFFIISFKNGNLIHFVPDNVQTFYDWLIAHGVRDIQKENPTAITPNRESKGWFKRKKQHEKL